MCQNEHRKEVRQEFDGAQRDLNEHRQETRQEFSALRQEMADMGRRFESRFNWMITSLIGICTLVVASAGVVVAILRP